jgi:hypothetical protein
MERAESGVARAGRSRWADVGRSAHPDAAIAAHDAARGALGDHEDAALLLVFASGSYDLRILAAAVAEVALGIPIVGCSSAGEIAADGPGTGSVVVIALGGEGFSFSLAAATTAGAAPRDAGMRVAACVGDVADRAHRVLLLLADGPAAIHAELVRGAYSVTGAGVPLVGGVAAHPEHGHADEHAVIYGGAVLHGAVVGVAIGSDAPIGIGVRHGWQPMGEPLLVTRAAPGRILELDGRPAADVYRDRLGGRDPDDACVLGHPLGLQQRLGELHIRSVTLDGAPDGGLECAMPAGALVWAMRSSADAILDAAAAACGDALGALNGAPPCLVVAFDCAARRKFLGTRAGEEIERLTGAAGPAALGGLYTYGEIARTRGILGFHHQTLVVLALA